LPAFQGLGDALGLAAMAGSRLAERRNGKTTQRKLAALPRQSFLGRLVGYEDVNDAERLRHDPATNTLHGFLGKRVYRQALLFEICFIKNPNGKSRLNGVRGILKMFSLFSNRTYRHLFAAQAIALVGTGLSTVALALLAYDLAGGDAGIVLGTALALKMVAYVGVAPVVGGIAHKLPRKFLLVTLDLARAAIVLSLPFVDAIWQVYVLIFLLNACSAGFTPTYQATLPDVLPDEKEYTRALSLSRLAYDLENLLSPTLAALALLLLSFNALFTANAVAFVISALLVITATLPGPRPSERTEGVWFNLSFGVKSYLATPRLRGLLLLSLAVAAAGAMVIVNTVVYVRGFLGGSDSDTAIALAASGAGSMIVALGLLKLPDSIPNRPVMLAGGVLLALGLLFGALSPGFLALLPVWFILGAGLSAIQTPAGRLLRMSCNEADRPAFFSAQFALSHACWLFTYPLSGWLGKTAGPSATFLILAGTVAMATMGAAIVWPSKEEPELEHVHGEMEHDHFHMHDEHHQHEHEGGEGPEPHRHLHGHGPIKHRHPLLIDIHHQHWPSRG
jgi:MFS family permease